ncbi:recombinase family protein [Bradyrhizobium sp. CSA112]|uniref:recombinase family protein n=1 Tax=Bradyrhizobium sp. CSA112 TaxID=2699170 RepID=UPI0023AF9FF9|nr:recombinase family protein [Bradyrhizobium sp. CSA112]MDE5454216.1 recombinase family protein [Bradyrhizobium sp. CSA112]
MVNALVIRRGTQLAKAQKALRAAQYVRMSTDFQRYSIQNQAAAIAAYAQQRNLTIVRTYVDEGRSGLRIKGRPGLMELIEDVQSGNAEFDHILVYDVSRWGRFQDVDESAHYEFVCKRNGIKVAYCAEQFDNDGSLLSSIFKNIKRVMAAEYSRELGVKVHTGQSRVAGLGYRVGGPLTFGLRRELVDESARSKGRLTKGERKALHTDRVRLQRGPDKETAVVRRIFHQFVIERKSYSQITRELNRAKVTNQGRPWSGAMIRIILMNENYIGNIVYNRTTRPIGQKLVNNPQDRWIRGLAVIDPIVDPNLFARAQKIMAERRIQIPEDQMLLRLRTALHRKGKLSWTIINNTPGLPSAGTYAEHFGPLRKIYALLGYEPGRYCDWIDSRVFWSDVLAKHANQVAETLRIEQSIKAVVEQSGAGLMVNGKLKITFLVARRLPKRGPNESPHWRAFRGKTSAGVLVVLRLNELNTAVKNYLVIPASWGTGTGAWVTLSDSVLARENAVRVDSLDEVIRQIKTRLLEYDYAAPTKPTLKNKRRKLGRPKTKNGRVRH